MVKTELLREAIDRSGLKLGFIADEIGITRQSLSSKIDGVYDFKVSEVSKLSKLIGLSATDRNTIFLSS